MSNVPTADTDTPTPAHAYQKYYVPAIFQPLTEQVFAVAAPERGDTVLDVASGTGIIARRAATVVGPAGRVVGVDISPGMVEVARSLPVPEGAGEIEWLQGDGMALDLPDNEFDFLYCQQGLQFFPDRAAGVREMRRVLDAGGRAVIATWRGVDRHPIFTAFADAEEPHLAVLGVKLSRAELEAPFSLGDPDELRSLLSEGGFSEVTITERPVTARFADADRFVDRMEFAYAALIPQFAEDPAAFDAYLKAIAEDTKDIVAEFRQGDDVIFPMHAIIAVAS
jgi:ubiquinone/menaquinone biosynthesis C-methylase UbiE